MRFSQYRINERQWDDIKKIIEIWMNMKTKCAEWLDERNDLDFSTLWCLACGSVMPSECN